MANRLQKNKDMAGLSKRQCYRIQLYALPDQGEWYDM